MLQPAHLDPFAKIRSRVLANSPFLSRRARSCCYLLFSVSIVNEADDLTAILLGLPEEYDAIKIKPTKGLARDSSSAKRANLGALLSVATYS